MTESTVTHLPAQLTTFVGRGRELGEVRRLLATTRLLTLTGAGGSGKTRLALEAAALEASGFAHGAVCIELAPILDGDRVAELLAATLGVSEQPGRNPVDALVEVLRTRSQLLVLDNCEHVIEACAALADTLLRACPQLRILATSRAALGIGGETAWLVPPLSLPEPRDVSVEAALRAEAVQLFVARASDVRRDFVLTSDNVQAVTQICRRLDGIPLALELAAARLRALSPEQIGQRLDNRFQLLTTGSRTALPRQQTLRATIDWSYDLLDERERLLFERLAVFAGSFELEAAESVCSDDVLPAGEILDLVSALVEQSLVELVEQDGIGRYRLLETVLQYAAERLAERGSAAVVRRRHASFYAALAARAEGYLTTPERRPWIDVLDREFDNLRRALVWTGEHDPHAQLALAGSLCWYWFTSERWSEGRRWLEAALAASADMDVRADRARALFAAGVLAGLQGDVAAAEPWLVESIALALELGDERQLAYSRNYLGLTFVQSGRPEAEPHLYAALSWFREHGDLYGLRLALLLLGTGHTIRGELADALRVNEEAVAVADAFGLPRERAIALQMLGTTLLHTDDLQRAADLFRESLAVLRDDPHLLFSARALDMYGIVLARRGSFEEATRHFGSANAFRERIGARLLSHDVRRLEPQLQAARKALGDTRFQQLWDEGRRRSLEEARTAALASAPTPAAAAPPPLAPAPVPAPRADAPPAPLQVRTLGALEIRRDGAVLPDDAWSHARPRELMLFLMCQPEGRTRDQIGLVFWPDASPAQVKNSFHVTLHHLRKTLGGAEWVVFENDRYCFNLERGVDFDAARFEAAAEAALRDARRGHDVASRLTDILELYRGEFLQDERVGDWHLEYRDRLRRLFVQCLSALGEARMRAESYAEAADVYQRILRIDDLDEEAHRRLIISLARAGERGRALRHYERLIALLEEEVGAQPEPETVAIYERLLHAQPA